MAVGYALLASITTLSAAAMSLLDTLTAGSYNTLYVWSIVLAIVLTYREGRRRGWGAQAWTTALAAWTLGGVVGSVLLAWAVSGTPGGKTAVGAIAGSMLALALASRWLRIPTASAMDTLAASIPAGGAIVRVGCFLAGCCSGLPTSLPWAVQGTHPVQLYDAGLSALLALVLYAGRERFKRPGSAALAMVAGLAAIRFSVQFVRESHAGSVGLDSVQWAMLGIMLAIVVRVATRAGVRPGRVAIWADPGLGRIATLGGSVIVAALIASRWLSPLETGVVFVVACVTALAIMVRLRAELPDRAPIGAVAVLLLQQAQVSEPPSTRRYFEVGLGHSESSYLFHKIESGPGNAEDCSSGPTILDYDRKHKFVLNSLLGGFHVDDEKGQSIGIRGQLFQGEDRMSAAVVRVGFPSKPQAHSETINGGAVAVDLDRSWFGLTAGFAAGSWKSADEEKPLDGSSSPAGIFGLRVGWMSRAYLEVERRSVGSAAMDLPIVQAGFALLDKRGDKLRLGAGEASTYIEGSVLITNGLRIAGLVTSGETPAFRLMAQQRFELKRK